MLLLLSPAFYHCAALPVVLVSINWSATMPTDLPIDTIIQGDCLEILRQMPSASIDAIISDPPAGISFMGLAFDSDRGGRDQWIAWLTEIMQEALRVCKPGAHAVIWAL